MTNQREAVIARIRETEANQMPAMETGKLCDLIESGKADICIAGVAGSGKTSLIKEIALSAIEKGCKVFIFDYGRAFKEFCTELGGNFIELNPAKAVSINPFANLPTEADKISSEIRADFFSNFSILLEQMVSTEEEISTFEHSLLHHAVKAVWEVKKNKASVTDIAKWLLDHDRAIANSLSKGLANYTEGGIYAGFFSTGSELQLKSDIVVIETEQLRIYPKLFAVVMLQVMLLNISHVTAKSAAPESTLIIFEDFFNRYVPEGSREARGILRTIISARKHKPYVVVESRCLSHEQDSVQGIFYLGKVVKLSRATKLQKAVATNYTPKQVTVLS